jgi:hypothetical protein
MVKTVSPHIIRGKYPGLLMILLIIQVHSLRELLEYIKIVIPEDDILLEFILFHKNKIQPRRGHPPRKGASSKSK